MNSIWLAIANLSVAIWVGTIIYQSSIVASTVFSTLDTSQSRHFLRTIFPRFYKLGLICAVLLLLSTTVMGHLADWPNINVWLLITASVMIVSQLVSIWLVPRINAASEQDKAAFKLLHTASVLLSVLILLLGIGVLLFVASGA